MWKDLNITQKSELMREFIRNGVTDRNEMARQYNSFAMGGPEENEPRLGYNLKVQAKDESFESRVRAAGGPLGIPYGDFYDRPDYLKKEQNYNYIGSVFNSETGHYSTRNAETGEMLKSPKHPTFDMAIEEDAKAGYYPFVNTVTGRIHTFTDNKDYTRWDTDDISTKPSWLYRPYKKAYGGHIYDGIKEGSGQMHVSDSAQDDLARRRAFSAALFDMNQRKLADTQEESVSPVGMIDGYTMMLRQPVSSQSIVGKAALGAQEIAQFPSLNNTQRQYVRDNDGYPVYVNGQPEFTSGEQPLVPLDQAIAGFTAAGDAMDVYDIGDAVKNGDIKTALQLSAISLLPGRTKTTLEMFKAAKAANRAAQVSGQVRLFDTPLLDRNMEDAIAEMKVREEKSAARAKTKMKKLVDSGGYPASTVPNEYVEEITREMGISADDFMRMSQNDQLGLYDAYRFYTDRANGAKVAVFDRNDRRFKAINKDEYTKNRSRYITPDDIDNGAAADLSMSINNGSYSYYGKNNGLEYDSRMDGKDPYSKDFAIESRTTDADTGDYFDIRSEGVSSHVNMIPGKNHILENVFDGTDTALNSYYVETPKGFRAVVFGEDGKIYQSKKSFATVEDATDFSKNNKDISEYVYRENTDRSFHSDGTRKNPTISERLQNVTKFANNDGSLVPGSYLSSVNLYDNGPLGSYIISYMRAHPDASFKDAAKTMINSVNRGISSPNVDIFNYSSNSLPVNTRTAAMNNELRFGNYNIGGLNSLGTDSELNDIFDFFSSASVQEKMDALRARGLGVLIDGDDIKFPFQYIKKRGGYLNVNPLTYYKKENSGNFFGPGGD